MELNIIGIGTCATEDFSLDQLDEGSSIKTLPAKEYMPRSVRRSSSRLAKIFYIATVKALEDARYPSDQNLPIIAGTAISEIDAAVDMLTQIHESRGKSLSPTLVQNSVHNAPASFLSIGFANTLPVMTITQSFLSGEAAVDYAFTLLDTTNYQDILVIIGDQYLNRWSQMLEDKQQSRFSQQLLSANFKEGAIALVLSLNKTTPNYYGKLTNSCVLHEPLADQEKINQEFLDNLSFDIGNDTNIFLRDYWRASNDLSKLIDLPGNEIKEPDYDHRNSMIYPFSEILSNKSGKNQKDIIFISREFNDYGFLQYQY